LFGINALRLNTTMNSRSFTSTNAPLLNRIWERQAPTRLLFCEGSSVGGDEASRQAVAISAVENASTQQANVFMRMPFF